MNALESLIHKANFHGKSFLRSLWGCYFMGLLKCIVNNTKTQKEVSVLPVGDCEPVWSFQYRSVKASR